MSERRAMATARAVGERLAEDLRRGDLGEILRLPELELPDTASAVEETRAALQRLPERDLAVLGEAIRALPRRVSRLERIKVGHDAPIPDRLVDAMPFLERERRASPLFITLAVVSVVGIVLLGMAMAIRRAAMHAESMAAAGTEADASVDTMTTTHDSATGGSADDPTASPTGGASLAPGGSEMSLDSSGRSVSPLGGWDAGPEPGDAGDAGEHGV